MDKFLKISEFATKLGVTIRTLRFYDKMGLLCPRSRDKKSGYKVYGPEEFKRFQLIISLKEIGFSLKEIVEIFKQERYNFSQILQMHRNVLKQRIVETQEALKKVDLLLSRTTAKNDVPTDYFLAFVREVKKMKSTYTDAQIEDIKKRYEHYDFAKVKDLEKKWDNLFSKFNEARKESLNPESQKVQKLAAHMQSMIEEFTGGDLEIEKNLDRAYEDNPEAALETWRTSKEIFEYAQLARRILKKEKVKK